MKDILAIGRSAAAHPRAAATNYFGLVGMVGRAPTAVRDGGGGV